MPAALTRHARSAMLAQVMRSVLPPASLCLLVACSTATGAAVPLVRAHAHQDLDCPDKKISVEPQGGGRYRAVGCGRSALYHGACEHLRCAVGREGAEPPPWRDRPEPGAIEGQR
ncbi:MAG: hypothetical protein HY744_14380 [Deltaproteobacteria bacterium]|nr:hypothetical protein [Deltaproteobacteria bacterium]